MYNSHIMGTSAYIDWCSIFNSDKVLVGTLCIISTLWGHVHTLTAGTYSILMRL